MANSFQGAYFEHNVDDSGPGACCFLSFRGGTAGALMVSSIWLPGCNVVEP